jgi:hypothetical protein
MSDEELARMRPGDLATVWGRAFAQLLDLWRAWLIALLEGGSAERPGLGDQTNRLRVPTVGGRTPRLLARTLVGESFGRLLDGSVVTFAEWGPGDPGFVLVDCWVDESRAHPCMGDIYRGDVVDEQGKQIATVALDAGS